MHSPIALRTNGHRHPRGLDTLPEFSWQLDAETAAAGAASANVLVTSDAGDVVWDSGEVTTDGAPMLSYSGPALDPRRNYTWRVRVSDADDATSDWSEVASFETGLVGGDLAPAQWITVDEEHPVGHAAPVQYFRHEFTLPSAPVSARSYSTALGWYRLGVNGDDATGDGIFPGFTAFEARVEYQVRDITRLLVEGANVVTLMLSDGRFRGRIGALGQPAIYGNQTAVIALLEIDLADGSTITVATDDSWEGGYGAIRSSDPRGGEVIDARMRDDWDRVGGAIPEPRTVAVADESRTLVGASAPEFTAGEHLPEIGRHVSPSGATVIDFGQNFHGVARFTARGPAGAELTVHHSEVVTPDGEVDLDYLFGGMPVDSHLGPNTLTLSGGTDVFEPTFSTQGFRYIAVTAPAGVEITDAVGVPIHADLDYHGTFRSSHPLVNRFHENVAWSMRGNFLDVPTDCPTRERSGWTGDAQVFAPTALLMADTAEYLRNWLTDARLQQHSTGVIPDIVPVDSDSWREGGKGGELMPGVSLPAPGSAGWGDAIVLIPWAIYRATGSTRALAENYDAMKRWVERYAAMGARNADDPFFIDSGHHYGEWLEPAGEGDGSIDLMSLMPELHDNPRAWVATAYFEHSSRLLATIARLLGEADDAAHFTEYADGARQTWQRHYLGDDGLLVPDAQATYVRALQFDLLPQDRRDAAVARLIERIRARDTHLGTGFLSTCFLLGQLSDNGADDVALDLVLQESIPSWLGQVKAGATTIWETWTGYDDTGKAMMSHNHYSLGASASWLYEHLAGIRAAEPGWRTITVDPLLNRRIDQVAASTATPYGRVAIDWKLEGETARAVVEIPAGATASVRLRGADPATAELDGTTLSASGLLFDAANGAVTVELGSGEHRFTWIAAEDAIVS